MPSMDPVGSWRCASGGSGRLNVARRGMDFPHTGCESEVIKCEQRECTATIVSPCYATSIFSPLGVVTLGLDRVRTRGPRVWDRQPRSPRARQTCRLSVGRRGTRSRRAAPASLVSGLVQHRRPPRPSRQPHGCTVTAPGVSEGQPTAQLRQHRAGAGQGSHHGRVVGVVSLGGDGRAFDVVHVRVRRCGPTERRRRRDATRRARP